MGTPTRRRSPKTVLLIEDDPLVAEVVQRGLDPARFIVETARHTGEARALLQVPPLPDLVILDLGLPFGGALDLLRGLKGQWPTLPILVASGTIRPADEQAARDAGADAFLHKPFGIAQLRQAVDDLTVGGP